MKRSFLLRIRTTLLGLLIVSCLGLGLFAFLSTSRAQIGGVPSAAIWTDVDQTRLPTAPAGTRIIVPTRYRTVALNTPAMRALLARGGGGGGWKGGGGGGGGGGVAGAWGGGG
jgi:hypothetical protein